MFWVNFIGCAFRDGFIAVLVSALSGETQNNYRWLFYKIRLKPEIIITNDSVLPIEQIIRKYTRRWIVGKSISDQIDFFHLNLVSSSMVIKVDFDLTMSIAIIYHDNLWSW